MDWTLVILPQPEALMLMRWLPIGMLLLMVKYSRSFHLRLAALLYAAWKTKEMIGAGDDLLTVRLFLVYLVQIYFFLAVFFGIERVAKLRSENATLRAENECLKTPPNQKILA
jgi:hypothetical protein